VVEVQAEPKVEYRVYEQKCQHRDMTHSWAAHLDVGAVRFTRPTARYDQTTYSLELG
jgi:hypothetical protein